MRGKRADARLWQTVCRNIEFFSDGCLRCLPGFPHNGTYMSAGACSKNYSLVWSVKRGHSMSVTADADGSLLPLPHLYLQTVCKPPTYVFWFRFLLQKCRFLVSYYYGSCRTVCYSTTACWKFHKSILITDHAFKNGYYFVSSVINYQLHELKISILFSVLLVYF